MVLSNKLNKANTKRLGKSRTKKVSNKKSSNKKSSNRKSNNKKSNNKKSSNRKTHKKVKSVSSRGGGFFNSESSLGQIIKNSKKSENALIKSYQTYVEYATKYFNNYNKHTNNLDALDGSIPNMESFSKLFYDKVMQNDITPKEKVDKACPLLLSMYDIDGDSSVKEIKENHIRQQINYIFYTSFQPDEKHLIKDIYINVSSDPTAKVNLKFTLINGIPTERNVAHTNYELKGDSILMELQDVVAMAKENVEYKPKISPALGRVSKLADRRPAKEGEEDELRRPASEDQSNNDKEQAFKDAKVADLGDGAENDLAQILGMGDGGQNNLTKGDDDDDDVRGYGQ